MDTLLADGENERAPVPFLREVAELSPPRIDGLHSAPSWDGPNHR